MPKTAKAVLANRPAGAKPKLLPVSWVITRTPARHGGWHYSVATADTLASFVVVVAAGDTVIINRSKTLVGLDSFSLVLGTTMATMSLCGHITYRGDWAGV